MKNKLVNLLIGLLFYGLTLSANASWEGDGITGSVSDIDYSWDNQTAIVDFSKIEFTQIFTNVTTTADFTANTVTLSYRNTSTSDNITYPALKYTFNDLNVDQSSISNLTLVNSNFDQSIIPSFTSNSITLKVPLQNTNSGELFSATFVFISKEQYSLKQQTITTGSDFKFDYFDFGVPNTGFTIDNFSDTSLDVNSSLFPNLGLLPDHKLQDKFVLFDGTLQVKVTPTDLQGERANIRTTYRMEIDPNLIRRDFLRARYIRQGRLTTVEEFARADERANHARLSDARIMRYVERESGGRWIRAVRAIDDRVGVRTDIRFIRDIPDGIIGHYGIDTPTEGNPYVWAILDKNSNYAVGLNVDNDNDGVYNSEDNCIDTAPGDLVDDYGCSIADSCPCENDSSWKNHGAYVRCVAHGSENFLALELVSEEEKDAIVSAAGQSECGVRSKN